MNFEFDSDRRNNNARPHAAGVFFVNILSDVFAEVVVNLILQQIHQSVVVEEKEVELEELLHVHVHIVQNFSGSLY